MGPLLADHGGRCPTHTTDQGTYTPWAMTVRIDVSERIIANVAILIKRLRIGNIGIRQWVGLT
jgi:hypothetical protein